MIKNIRHTGIAVEEMNTSLCFYRDKLGFEIAKQVYESGQFIDGILGMSDVSVTTVKMTLNDGPMIELLDFASHKKDMIDSAINDIGPTHLAFTVDNIDRLYRDFIHDGIEFISPPAIPSDGYAKVAFCRAPEGTYIELVELL
jgi:catechol 2,3-dioxygenase-like lactoylglutathione lyase family enzyme